MSDQGRVKKGMRIVEEDLIDAENYFKQNKERDSIQKLFQIYENCFNIMKDSFNGRPLTEHDAVSRHFSYYFEAGLLEKDYSENHKRLDKLRKMAAFGPYAKDKTKPSDMTEIKKMLEEAKSLVKEVKRRINKLEK